MESAATKSSTQKRRTTSKPSLLFQNCQSLPQHVIARLSFKHWPSMTPLYPTFNKQVADAVQHLIDEQIEPWVFMRQGLSVKCFNGRGVTYEGIDFEGSPRTVFWSGYIEPFLEDLIVKQLAAAVVAAKDRDVEGRELLGEVQGLLFAGCQRVFYKMAEVDRRLRGHGYPNSVDLRSVDGEIAKMRHFLDRHVQAELQMWNPRSCCERWYERNKFWVWALGIVVTIVSLIIKFI